MGLCHVWPYLFLLAGRPYVGVGSMVRGYLLWPGFVAVVLGMLCLGAVVCSKGAVVVSSWTSWRIFLQTFPPSVPFFLIPVWLSRNI